jgi:hypothetical protein
MPTSRSLFWAEGEGSLARALARVAVPVGRPTPVPEPASPVEPLPAPASAPIAAAAEAVAAPPPPVPAAGFTPPFGSLEDRIEAWLQWVAGRAGAPHAFLLDRDGLPMLQLGGDTRVIELASLARGLMGRLGEAAAGRGRLAVSVRLESEKLLRLIDLSTPLGPLTVGFVTRDPEAAAFEGGLRVSLARCFAAETASPTLGS